MLSLVAKTHAEMVDYAQSEKIYAWCRRVCPHRLEGAEIYSTVLWHLKRDVELSHLAHFALGFDRLSPHTWCIMGNCFSAQKVRSTHRTRAHTVTVDVDVDFDVTLLFV